MKKHIAIAVAAGLWAATGCMEHPKDTTPSTKPTMTMSTTQPGMTGTNSGTVTTPATMPAKPMMTDTKPMTPASTDDAWDALVSGKPVFFRARAEGVQIYEGKTVDGKPAWSLKAPEALIYDEKGRNIGKHYGSPDGATWEMTDGSKIVGEKKGSLPKPDSIPFLTISVKSHDGNPKGKLAPVGFVQRVETTGGLAPTTPPTAEQMGKEERVPYRATYLFYAGK